MDSFSKRRPPKFSEPIDFNLKSSESYYSNLLVDRFNGLFSSGWSTNDQNGLFNFSNSLNSSSNGGVGESNNTRDSFNNNFASNGVHGNNGGSGGLYSSNLTHATNGINVNPFNTKGLMNSYDYNNQWIAPPRSCPPIGTRDSFNSFSITPRNNHANSNHSSKINNHQIIPANNYYPLHSANNLNRDNLNNFNNNDFINGHQPLTRQNNNNSNNNTNNNSYVVGNNNNNNQTTMANNNTGYNNNLSLAANSNLNAQQASYVPPRVRRRNPSCTECVFCKNNGHPPSFYKGHILKCPEGKVICPVLREYDCPICHNGGGEKAHTLRYCPWNKPSFWQRANR